MCVLDIYSSTNLALWLVSTCAICQQTCVTLMGSILGYEWQLCVIAKLLSTYSFKLQPTGEAGSVCLAVPSSYFDITLKMSWFA